MNSMRSISNLGAAELEAQLDAAERCVAETNGRCFVMCDISHDRLPRYARDRDNHKETNSAQQQTNEEMACQDRLGTNMMIEIAETVFLSVFLLSVFVKGGGEGQSRGAPKGKKTPFWAPFYPKNDQFTKTGSGQP
jgi:hypothetical protein